MSHQDDLWTRFQTYSVVEPRTGIALDPSRMHFDEGDLDLMRAPFDRAFTEMKDLESGAIANPDEHRMVGHYWLRAPELAPNVDLRRGIEQAQSSVVHLARRIHDGEVVSERGGLFRSVLIVGIGGSALGPQFVSAALASRDDKMSVSFLDNTDPDGFDRVLEPLGDRLHETLTVVISKSGGTKETRNGMLETAAAYQNQGLTFAKHAIAITGEGSELDRLASMAGWIARLPMWDWIGGRTSETSVVGLFPAALQGINIADLLDGARAMDLLTRVPHVERNPAAMLAAMWHIAGGGHGAKSMVVLPYKDRLILLSRYLQQLIMESLGKEKDQSGTRVLQGLSVFGNKGSTDQHAYVQQLRDGLPNFFALFVEVLRDREGKSLEVDPGTTSGDYLAGFYLGTRRALFENGRESITITLPEVTPRVIGGLVALFERAVGLYASLIGINAYDQPGVEAGKRGATEVLELQQRVISVLRKANGEPLSVERIVGVLGGDDSAEIVFKIVERLAQNPDRGLRRAAGEGRFDGRYFLA